MTKRKDRQHEPVADPASSPATEGPGDEPRVTLTRERIVELALETIDRDGLDALNMRRLARHAGVKPMSLYHHFPSKQSILDAVAESIAAAAIGLPPADGPWQARVRFLFANLHLLVQAHPRALPLISTAVVRTPSGRRWMEELMRVLLKAGFTPDRAAAAYHTLGAYTLGVGYARLLSLEVSSTDVVAQLAGHWREYPHLMRVGLRLTAWDQPGEFESGFEVLLQRFSDELDATQTRQVTP